MPTPVETVPYIPEHFDEQHTDVIGTTTAPDQKIDGSVLPEMPLSHPEVDAATISINGLKNCTHFAEMYEKDPERAKAEETQIIKKVQEVSALREQGMSAKEIKAKMLADNLMRARTRAKIVEKEGKANTEQKSVPKDETTQNIKPSKPEPYHTQNPARESMLSKQKSPDEHVKVLPAIQRRQEDKKPLVNTPEKVAPVPKQIVQAVKNHQVTTAETQVGTDRDAVHIERQRTDAFTSYHEHFASQDKLPVDSPSSEQLLALQPSKTSVGELAVELLSAASASITGELTHDPEVDTLTLSLLETTEGSSTYAMPEATTSLEVAVDKQLELRFEPEVVDTYKELLALVEGEKAKPDGLDESNERIDEIYEAVQPLAAETVLREEAEQDFETFLDLQPEPEEVVSLETIIEQASDEQPLEQTFMQLARYLSDTLQETQDASEISDEVTTELGEKQVKLRTILQDIAELIPTCYSISEEAQEQRIQITPEMTQKLLMLLRALGYKQPKEVLLEFVRLHGLAFLLEALQYVCQLNYEENRQEFLTKTLVKSTDNNRSRVHIGKLIAALAINRPQLVDV